MAEVRPSAAAPAPPGGTSSWSSLPLLTAYLVMLFAVPAPMVVTALGQVGGPATILSVGCFLWWAYHTVNPGPSTVHGPDPVRRAALILVLAALLTYAHSAALALPVDERSPADAWLLRFAGWTGVVCLCTSGLLSRDTLWTFINRVSLFMGALSIVAVCQILTGQVLVDRISIPGLSPAQGLEIISRGVATRPNATATHPIEFAAVLSMGMPFVFLAATHIGRWSVWHRVSAVLVPVVILLSGARTAIVCSAVAFVVMMLAWRPLTRAFAGLGALAMLAAMFVTVPGSVGTIRGLFQGASNDPSVQSRTNSYATVAEFWERHPWFGRGFGTFLPKYWILDNMYLNLLIGGGLIGLGALLWLILTASRSALRARREAVLERDRQAAVAALAATLAGAVSLALFDVFAFPQASGMFFVSMGLCGATYRYALLQRSAAVHDGSVGRRWHDGIDHGSLPPEPVRARKKRP